MGNDVKVARAKRKKNAAQQNEPTIHKQQCRHPH